MREFIVETGDPSGTAFTVALLVWVVSIPLAIAFVLWGSSGVFASTFPRANRFLHKHSWLVLVSVFIVVIGGPIIGGVTHSWAVIVWLTGVLWPWTLALGVCVEDPESLKRPSPRRSAAIKAGEGGQAWPPGTKPLPKPFEDVSWTARKTR